jgi:hypothetical protein
MVNICAFDVPPPGVGLKTVTLAVPAVAISAAVIAAVSCVPLTYVVVRSEPFHLTIEPLTKLVPFTVSVKAPPSAVAEDGLRLVIAGAGLLMVKICAFDVPPPGVGLNTVTLAVPALAMSAAVIAAVSCVVLTYVVVRSTPFHLTTELLMKLVPLTVSVNAAPPAVADEGLRLEVVGTGLFAALIVNVCVLDVPPPGVGLKTVTLAVPAVAMSAVVIAAVS